MSLFSGMSADKSADKSADASADALCIIIQAKSIQSHLQIKSTQQILPSKIYSNQIYKKLK